MHSVTVLVSLKGTALLNTAKAQVGFNHVLSVYQKLSGYVTYQVPLRGAKVTVLSSVTFGKYLLAPMSDIWAHFYWYITVLLLPYPHKMEQACLLPGFWLKNIVSSSKTLFQVRCLHFKLLGILSFLQEITILIT